MDTQVPSHTGVYEVICSHSIHRICSIVCSTQSTKDFTGKYTERIRNTEFKWNSLHAIAFDAVWTLALVLNYTEEMI